VQKRGAEPRAPRGTFGPPPLMPDEAPTFKDIAAELEQRLAGRILIAHNARFDYAFLKAEFQRARIAFDARVLCTVMLSRRLYPQYSAHDLGALIERHGLAARDRHRALPDAQILWELWCAMHRENDGATITDTVATLLAGPVMPAHLDVSLIDRLPDATGIYVFHGADEQILRIGEARNLRLHLVDYFRLDRASPHALAIAHRIEKITWRVTQGMLGARLHRIALANASSTSRTARQRRVFCWRARPDQYPSLELVPMAGSSSSSGDEFFGMFDSERKARNALLRLAKRHSLCHALLGLAQSARSPCPACSDRGCVCTGKKDRLEHLVKCFIAMRPLRVSPWPYPGPIVVRERRDLHVFNEWRHLGTAQVESEVLETLTTRPGELDKAIYAYLAKRLPKLPPHQIRHVPIL